MNDRKTYRTRRAHRRDHALIAGRAVGEALPFPDSGIAITAIGWGNWSFIDLLTWAEQAGPITRLRIVSWRIGGIEAEELRDRLAAGCDVRAIVGKGAAGTRVKGVSEYTDEIVAALGDRVRHAKIHAKVLCIDAGGLRLTIRTSANMNKNLWLEQYDIDDDGPLGDWLWDAVEAISVPMSAADSEQHAKVQAVYGGQTEMDDPFAPTDLSKWL